MISDMLLRQLKEDIIASSRPLFLFDNDPDGLCAFLIMYKFCKKGNGWPIKGSELGETMADKVNNYQPDLVVVLDKPEISQDFFDIVKAKTYWLDHHKPQKRKNVIQLNPRIENDKDNSPTSYWAYKTTGNDLWLAMTGIISDWQLPPKDILQECFDTFPTFLPRDTKTAQQGLFEKDVGKLSQILSFNLKGKNTDVLSSIRMLTRIDSPQDIIECKTPQARLIFKRYEKRLNEYKAIMQRIEVGSEKLLVFTYTSSDNSFTTDISNELLYKHPDKIIIVARQSGDSYKCSLRSAGIPIEPILKDVISNINGTGGGHQHACGAVINNDDFTKFVDIFRDEISRER